MNKFINENLLKMNTEEFLSNIKKAFNDVFSNGNIEKINLMNYLSEKKWLSIKKCGLLLPFLPEKFGGRKNSQLEIQEVLRIAGNYGVPVTLRTGIEGALVLQPLLEYGNEEQIEKGLEMIFNGEGGGLAITEPETSGSAIAKEMQSYYEYVDENTIHVKADKYWQGNSQSDFLLIAAKEKKDGKLSKVISLILVPREYITYDVLNSEGLKAVRYAVNYVDAKIPAKYIIKLSESKANCLREFQNIFIRSRLQLVGMTHGIMEYIVKNINKFAKKEIPFVPNVNEMTWYAKGGDPRWDANQLWTSMGHLYKGGMWILKKSKITGFTDAHMPDNPSVDLRIDYRTFSNHSLTPGLPSASEIGDYFYLPALGYYISGQLSGIGRMGNYWTSSANPSSSQYAYTLNFVSNQCNLGSDYSFPGRVVQSTWFK